MPRSARYAYRCPVCAALYWSAQYRKSLLHECLSCFQRDRHYRVGTREEARDKARVERVLAAAHARPAD